jgi:hypothetical protein
MPIQALAVFLEAVVSHEVAALGALVIFLQMARTPSRQPCHQSLLAQIEAWATSLVDQRKDQLAIEQAMLAWVVQAVQDLLQRIKRVRENPECRWPHQHLLTLLGRRRWKQLAISGDLRDCMLLLWVGLMAMAWHNHH